jgi:hypothetical protein
MAVRAVRAMAVRAVRVMAVGTDRIVGDSQRVLQERTRADVCG